MRMLFVFLAGLAMNPMVEASVGAEPTGGLTAAAAEPVRVFVLAGQSNMEGQSVAVVPAGPLERLQRVVLVLDLSHGDLTLMQYGLTDPKEFFAEMTEAFFGSNDFQPFNRAELRTTEPAICDLLESVWREDAPATTP